MNKILSHDELQHIEHINNVLKEHQELVKLVVNETEQMLQNYVPIITDYVNAIQSIRTAFGNEVKHILQSTRELGIATNNTQAIVNFGQAAQKLDEILKPELVEKLRKIIKE